MRILVCGDRNWTDADVIQDVLIHYPPGTVIIHGACRGADRIAGEIAKRLGMEVLATRANWRKFGKWAGPFATKKCWT